MFEVVRIGSYPPSLLYLFSFFEVSTKYYHYHALCVAVYDNRTTVLV
jgi:hypothetical protein